MDARGRLDAHRRHRDDDRLSTGRTGQVLCYCRRAMPIIFAQSVVEYGGAASSSAVRVIDVIGDQLNTVFYAVNNSVSEHPFLWGAAVCVTGWLLMRPRR